MNTTTTEKLTRQQIDAMVRKMFQDPEAIRDFVMARLNPHIFAVIDTASLQLKNSSFVEGEFKKNHSDFVISAEVSQKKFYIYILIQHHISDRHHGMIKILDYSNKLAIQHIEQVEKKLPVIFTFMLRTEAYRDAEPKSIRQMVQDPVIFANAIEDIGVLGIVKEYGVGVPKATKPDLVDLIIEHGSSPKKFKDS